MKKPTPDAMQRLLGIAQEIEKHPAGPGHSLTFLPQLLVLTGLPHRDPGDVVVWERRNGNISFFMQQGAARDGTGKWVRLGYPFGVYPRLFNQYITTHVVRTGSPDVPMGDSFREFEHLLGVEHGGKNSRGLYQQARRFMRTTLGWEGRLGRAEIGEELRPIEGRYLFWDPEHPDQRGLWTSGIRLNPTYFDCIRSFHVPMDERAYRALGRAGSSMAMDVLSWLTLRTHDMRERTPLLSWATLMQQLGAGYKNPAEFARAFKKAFALVRPFYRPRVDFERGGIVLHPARGWSLVPRRPRKELPPGPP